MAQDVKLIAHLPIGGSNVAGDRIGPGYEFHGEAEAQRVMAAVAAATRPIKNKNEAFCIDDRPIVDLGGKTDPAFLGEIVAARLPGGTYLAATKAAVAADAVVVKDAQDFLAAYDIVAGVLDRAGFEDAGHEGCGAEKVLASCIRDQVDAATAFDIARAAGVATADEAASFAALADTQKRRLDEGFYNSFTPDWHQARIKEVAPGNYAVLRTEHDAVHGHKASGLYLPADGMGLSNGFDAAMLFVYTHSIARDIAQRLGGSDEERRTIELAFVYDLINVSNALIAKPEADYPGLAVLKQQPVPAAV